VAPDQLAAIQEELIKNGFIDSVSYDKPLIILLTENIKKISFWVLVMSALFLIIAVLLINSSIRLSVYAKRFTIKTMQMVGATKSFIRAPFIIKSIQLGLLGSVLAIIALFAVLSAVDDYFPDMEFLSNPIPVLGLFIFIIVMGVFISALSTFLATQRFLNLRSDQLYY
jgi:cell division transport system permease protein